MTKKPTTMAQHGGEISFPGGKLTNSDYNLLETASILACIWSVIDLAASSELVDLPTRLISSNTSDIYCGSNEITSGSFGKSRLASATCREEMAQTSQIAWVINRSGCASFNTA